MTHHPTRNETLVATRLGVRICRRWVNWKRRLERRLNRQRRRRGWFVWKARRG